MTISTRPIQSEMPQYSLSGDLLAYLNCATQYRFNNKGSLPPSAPVQQWFGEFIHGVMEEGCLHYKEGLLTFPCSPEYVQRLCVDVANRLRAKGLFATRIFAFEDTPEKKAMDHPANKRAFTAISMLGPSLFPLITGNEIRLNGMRDMPGYDPNLSRNKHYTITGIADVVSHIDLDADKDNMIVRYLMSKDEVRALIESNREFEVIIDYKGMDRPDLGSEEDRTWDYHAWQVQTYMWLRKKQVEAEGSDMPVIAGILLYLNELMPSEETLTKMTEQISRGKTDIMPDATDAKILRNGQTCSDKYRIDRCFRIIPYDEAMLKTSLEEFDEVVFEIESKVVEEIRGGGNVIDHWGGTYKRERCTACDMKGFCKAIPPEFRQKPQVP